MEQDTANLGEAGIAQEAREAAAQRAKQAVQPSEGRLSAGGGFPSVSELAGAAQGVIEPFVAPFQARAPMPAGLTQDDAGNFAVDGVPASQHPEGKKWLENQRSLQDWGAATAFALVTGGMGGAEKGALGVFGGKGATGADLSALSRAKTLAEEGGARHDIIKQTGWFKGVDNKWRFEISDRGMKPAEDFKSIRSMFDAYAMAPGEGLSFGSVWRHPELEKQYPGIRDLKIKMLSESEEAYGMLDLANKTLYLNPNISMKQATSTALHELQHYIQSLENFQNGGNMQEMLKAAEQVYGPLHDKSSEVQTKTMRAAFEAYRSLVGETEARNVQIRAPMTSAERGNRPPWTTSQVPEAQQLVRKEHPSNSESNQPVLKPVDHDPFAGSADARYVLVEHDPFKGTSK